MPALQSIKRSDAVQEIISRKPSLIERWSLMIFLLLIVLFFAGAWFISYPDYIQASATLTGSVRAGATDSPYFAQINIPQSNFSKIQKGQRVLLHLDAYPYQEFGSVEGRLVYIAESPLGSGFPARILLNNGLLTNRRKTVPFRNGLTAQALIITRNTRLLQRFYYNLTRAINP